MARQYRKPPVAVLKAPNAPIPVDDPVIPYADGNQIVSSRKVDGNRGICFKGEIYSSTMKEPRNALLHRLVDPLKEYSTKEDMVIDYEIAAASIPHHAELSGIVNSDENPLPQDLCLWVFDAAPYASWYNQCEDLPYRDRIPMIEAAVLELNVPWLKVLKQRPVRDAQEATLLFEQDLENGDEGSMLRTLDIWWDSNRMRGGYYKHGRATAAQQTIFKQKLYVTLEGQIVGVHQRRKMKADWPREYNEAGHLIRPLTQDAYELDDMVGALEVRLLLPNKDGSKQIVQSEIGFGPGFSLWDRQVMWQSFTQAPDSIMGHWVEFKHMPYGAMDGGRLRAGRLYRTRPDLDANLGVGNEGWDSLLANEGITG